MWAIFRTEAFFVLVAGAAFGGPITWTLYNTSFNDGGTAAGYFVLDADAGTVTDWSIITSAGSALKDFTYTPTNSTISTDLKSILLASNETFPNGLPPPNNFNEKRFLQLSFVSPLKDSGDKVNIDLTASNECLNCDPYRTFTKGFVQAGTMATFSVTPAALSFQIQQGAPPQSQSLQIAGTAGVTWVATASTSTGDAWLSLSPAAGQIPASLTAMVSSGNVTPGTYQGSITIQVPGATSASTTISITLDAIAATSSPTQTFSTLLYFDGSNGYEPYSTLVQGADGSFYGTTTSLAFGTIFKITPDGTLTTLYSFGGRNGSFPLGGLVLGTDGNFYGTTQNGGTNSDVRLCGTGGFGGPVGVGCGTVFKITPGGTLTTIYSFCTVQATSSFGIYCADGQFPSGALVQGADGNFYGTTQSGGVNLGNGTVFKIIPGGTLTTLHTFYGGADGSSPRARLIQATDGSLYGTTMRGGSNDLGTIFKITPGGALTPLYSFVGGHPYVYPFAGLVQATDGNLYGTTGSGGANGLGMVFKITPAGTFTTLHSFDDTDGSKPQAELVQATDGNLYGTTSSGGANGQGTVFKITPAGTFTTLHSFDETDGAMPEAALVQGTDGNLYGTSGYGGPIYTGGTVFSLGVGLSAFVKTLPASGAVGTPIIILGNNLTGATSVSFDGAPATFTVVSDFEIETTVPVGATSGSVQVTTPSGTLYSNVAFQVSEGSQ
jgi:uncharacterized repeat protein (TIGR03803 family)